MMMWSTGRPRSRVSCSKERTRGATLMNWGRAPTMLTSLSVIVVELRHGAHDVTRLVGSQFGIDRNREALPGRANGLRAMLGCVAEMGETRLEVKRHGVVDLRAHVGLAQVVFEIVPPLRPNDVLVEDVAIAGQRARSGHVIAEARLLKRRRVKAGVRLPTLGPPVQICELDEQDGGLELVEAEVAPHDEMVVPGLAAVDS